MPERARTRQGPIAPPDTTLSVVLSVGLLSASLLWAWYALIYSPTFGIEHDRALTGNLVQGLTVELQTVDRYDESRARNLVVGPRHGDRRSAPGTGRRCCAPSHAAAAAARGC